MFGRAEVRILPGVGRWFWLGQTDEVAEYVISFLRERLADLIGFMDDDHQQIVIGACGNLQAAKDDRPGQAS